MPTFDLVVVGSGGGPSETDLSGYLLKSCTSSWEEGIIALEAGSCLGALQRILATKPELFGASESGRAYSAATIYSFVRAFLITHAHLDHIMGLVLLAGALRGKRKSLMGTTQTLKDLESVFRPSRVWPNLASWGRSDSDHLYLYDPLYPDGSYKTVCGDISVRIMPLSHGSNPIAYESSAFFVRHDPTLREFLFFGDVEPDSIAANPKTTHVWRAAAPKIPEQLNTIFIECSWPSGRPDAELYGHLTPEHLVQELENLAVEVVKSRESALAKTVVPKKSAGPARKKLKLDLTTTSCLHGALCDLRVYVMHCKEDLDILHDRHIGRVITDQVKNLVKQKCFGVEILYAEQGTRIEI